MASKFEELVNGMVNVSLGAAVMVGEKGKEFIDDLGAKGEAVRSDPTTPDFGRSMSDIFSRAGGAVSDATERLSASGATAAEKILDELIRARVRDMSATERTAYLGHVKELIESVEDASTTVEAEVVVEVEDAAGTDGDDSEASSDSDTEGAQA